MEPFPVPGVEKTILHGGKGDVPLFQKNSKVIFHFRTLKVEEEGEVEEVKGVVVEKGEVEEVGTGDSSVIDDSRTLGSGPFELLIGREFKLAVWEQLVKSMRIGEVSRFKCPYKMVLDYPRVAKALREMALKQSGKPIPHSSSHNCGFGALQGTGHPDLDKIYHERKPLTFEFELLCIEQPGDYKKDSWAMTSEEKSLAVGRLREEGNTAYKAGDYETATAKYFEALHYLEELVSKEKPKSEPWLEIEQRKIPLLLNYSQCMLLQKSYAEVIQHTTTVLDIDPDNIKALYRRAKAHAASWNTKEAEDDFAHAVQLDPSLAKSVERELKQLRQRVKVEEEVEKLRLQGKLF